MDSFVKAHSGYFLQLTDGIMLLPKQQTQFRKQ